MAQLRNELKCPLTIGLLAILFGAPAATVAAQERDPIAVEVVAPVSGNNVGKVATVPGAISTGKTPVSMRRRAVPVDDSTYKAMKDRAVMNPRAQRADVLNVPSGKPTTVTQGPPPPPTSFEGLDTPSAAGCGQPWNPPDTIVSKSYTRVLEGANSAVRLSSTTGTALDTKALNTFFDADCSKGTLFDPKVYFDRNAANPRFYVISLQQSGDSDATGFSRIWLAVSRSPEPASLDGANWCRYSLEGKRPLDPPFLDTTSTWADYPGLGVGLDALVISTSQNNFKYGYIAFAAIRVLNKRIVSDNALSCPDIKAFTFQPSGDGSISSLQPVQHYTSPSSVEVIQGRPSNPAYLINAHFGSSKVYKVWRALFSRGTPVLQGPVKVAGTFTYDVPPDAPQKGSTVAIDTGDGRITQAAGIGDDISAVHPTVCNTGGGPNEACTRYVRIHVGNDPFRGTNLTAALTQEATFGDGAGIFDLFPGIAVNGLGETIVAFHRSSAASFLSSFWKIGALDSTVSPPKVVFGTAQPLTVNGDCSLPEPPPDPDNPKGAGKTRAGDYIGAQTDPADFRSFWLAGERASAIGGVCQWKTQIRKVTTKIPGP